MTTLRPLEDVFLAWGETARWDERRQRLYCVDCATQRLCWLESGQPPLHTMPMPSLPTGATLCDDGRLVIALDDGLHVVEADAGTIEFLTPYPDGLRSRANDLAADLDGNLVTGSLDVARAGGSYWWFSTRDGWRLLDEGIGNANGPVVLDLAGRPTLVFGDTQANRLYAYDYAGRDGRAESRVVFADTSEVGGSPDGACADGEGGVWSCVLGPGRLVRYTADGVAGSIDVGVPLPSDVTFGGKNLDVMFVTTIASSPNPASARGGQVLRIEQCGYRGRNEPRLRL